MYSTPDLKGYRGFQKPNIQMWSADNTLETRYMYEILIFLGLLPTSDGGVAKWSYGRLTNGSFFRPNSPKGSRAELFMDASF